MYYMLKTLGEGGIVDNTRINLSRVNHLRRLAVVQSSAGRGQKLILVPPFFCLKTGRKLRLFFVLRGTKNCRLFIY